MNQYGVRIYKSTILVPRELSRTLYFFISHGGSIARGSLELVLKFLVHTLCVERRGI